MKKIYLATPYSHKDPKIMQTRFELVNKVAGDLIRHGYIVFSPISHNHVIVKAGNLPTGWDFWLEYDKTFIEWADKVYVLMQDGWKDSVGVNTEIEIAKEFGKPIVYISN